MAIAYNLDLDAPESPLQVARELIEVIIARNLTEEAASADALVSVDGVVTRNGTWLRVCGRDPGPDGTVLNRFGFTPTVTVVFRYDKEGDFGVQYDDMARLASELLERVPGDAVLHLDYEVIWLLRLHGEVSLNERNDIWPPHRLALITSPFRRATYHFEDERSVAEWRGPDRYGG